MAVPFWKKRSLWWFLNNWNIWKYGLKVYLLNNSKSEFKYKYIIIGYNRMSIFGESLGTFINACLTVCRVLQS